MKNQYLIEKEDRKKTSGKMFPLSFGQRRLWFIEQYEANSTVYNLINATRIKGFFDQHILAESINLLVERHEIFKTVFQQVNGEPVQLIIPDMKIAPEVIDLSNNSTQDKAGKVQEYIDRENNLVYDLEKGPLLRVTLLKVQQDEHVFILSMHHIIADGWTIRLFMKEVVECYDAILKGRAVQLTPVQWTYADFTLWQIQSYENGLFDADLDYWISKLKDVSGFLRLPTDLPRPNVQQFSGNTISFEISQQTKNKLVKLARDEKATLYMLLIACFKILLYRYTGEEEIVVGTPIAGRNLLQTELIMGYFSNTLVLHTQIDNQLTFQQFLKLVVDETLDAYEHQNCPFEKIIEILNPERHLNYSPLFQVFFSFQNRSLEKHYPDGLSFEMISVKKNSAKFDLSFEFEEAEDRLFLNMEYNTSLFYGTTIERLFNYYRNIMDQVTANPGILISRIDMLTANDKELFEMINDTEMEYPQNCCVHELFENRVEQLADKTALIYNSLSLTYNELNTRANQLAHYLLKHFVKSGQRIGISMDSGIETISSILGIWKAGCSYIPLDPLYPEKRMDFILQDAGIKLLLVDSDRFESTDFTDLKIVNLTADWDQIKEESISNPTDRTSADNLAYIMYTSGSTGKPKGVKIGHRSVTNFLSSMMMEPGINQSDLVLSLTNYTFDISVLEMFLPLISGASVIVVNREDRYDAFSLGQQIKDHRPTFIQATPATWKMLIEAKWEGDPDRLKILCGGEALPPDLAKELVKRGTEVWNMYGPTETTIWSLIYRVEEVELAQDIPIGRPIANTYVYILDKSMNPVPPGSSGDIYIGGIGVTQGYINLPEENLKKLIDNQWGKSGKVYLTGDKGKFMPDGLVYFLGRDDHQSKIRGYRVEAGEIERVINRFAGVAESIVSAFRDETGENSLAAYLRVESGSDNNFDTNALFDFLQLELPGYMVPAYYTIMDKFPLNSHGKIDHQNLPSPTQLNRDPNDEHDLPRDEFEKRMLAIWKKVLRIENLGVNDNFFRIGGHSILAVELLNEINGEFNAVITLKDLFHQPVLKYLSDYIKQQDCSEQAVVNYLIEHNVKDLSEPFPLTDIQLAYWLGRNSSIGLGNTASHLYQEIEIMDLDVQRFNDCLCKLIERHDLLRAVVLSDGQQVILQDVAQYQIEITDLRDKPSEESAEILKKIRSELSHQVLPADRWPLFDIRVSILQDKLFILHISFDFLIADAWSFRILLKEIGMLYENPQTELPVLDISFRDYVLALKQIEKTSKYEDSQDYWLSRLDSIPGGPELPLTIDPGSISKPMFKRLAGTIDRERWQRLKEQAMDNQLTPTGLLLAVFSEVLSKWAKERHFTLNVTLFQRLPLHRDINNIVGDFTSLLLLEVDQNSAGNFLERARHIQQRLWNDIDHNLYSGSRVMNQLIKQGYSQGVMPVVFTSLLGFADSENYLEKVFTIQKPTSQSAGISQTPQIWLDHQVSEVNGALEFNWDYVKDIFPTGMIEEMFAAYCKLLDRLVLENVWKESDSLFFELIHPKVLSPNNQIEPAKELLHTLFSNRAAKSPGSQAVISFDRTLTYEELERSSNTLAAQLTNRFGQQKAIMAVFMEKGWEQVVAVLGIVKAGCAYLPIDTDLPEERIRYLLAKGNVQAVIAQKQTRLKIVDYTDIEIITIDADIFEQTNDYQLSAVQSPADLAYVIFTSGSTGLPKGVMIDHAGVVNTIMDINCRFAINSSDRILAVSALSFDLSVYDIFGILAAGGAIVIPDPREVRHFENLARLVKEQSVTIWNTVPAFMKLLLQSKISDLDDLLGDLRLVLLSGDWIPLNLPLEIKELNPQIQVVSLGGATEGSIWSIIYPIETVDPEWKSIPYGRALTNQSVYVFDQDLCLCPTWVVGELYIGGIGVALGYLGDADKTEYSFRVHPKTGERLYRTGDLGRYLPDGNIEFLGREDTQVKIQGFRIELGEIEAAIKESVLIKDAVVIARGEKLGDKKLAAYVIPDYDEINNSQISSSAAGVILDSPQRLDFKLKEHGIRKDLGGYSIDLNSPSLLPGEQMFVERRSYRKFSRDRLAFEEFAKFINCLAQISLEGIYFPKYLYGSSGGLYPVQVYVYIKNSSISDIQGGIYYYNPGIRKLVSITNIEIDASIHVPENQSIFEESAFSLFLVGQLDAIIPMYGKERSEKYCLLEAGAISQLLETNAPQHNIGLCQIGRLNFDVIRDFFNLNENSAYLHCLVGGLINHEQRTQMGMVTEWQEYQQSKKSTTFRKTADDYLEVLREHLVNKIPYYMIPSSFNILKEFPLTANGKVDRKALSALNQNKAEEQNMNEKNNADWQKIDQDSLNDTEKILIEIWERVLEKNKIAKNDNFFNLGGDSLLITRVHREIERELEIEVQIVDLFKYPTISSLAQYLIGQRVTDEHKSGVNRAELRLSQRQSRRRGRV